jgi:integrase
VREPHREAGYPDVGAGAIAGVRPRPLHRHARWRDVDLKNRVIHVRNVIAHDGPKCYEKEPKTKNGRRDIPFNEDLAKTISARLETARLECEEAGVELAPDMYVIGSVDDGRGRYMHPHTLWQGWKANATSLGLKGVRGKTPSFHDLRHTYATVAAHLPGADLKGVQMNLGHASIKTTMDIYASDNPRRGHGHRGRHPRGPRGRGGRRARRGVEPGGATCGRRAEAPANLRNREFRS